MNNLTCIRHLQFSQLRASLLSFGLAALFSACSGTPEELAADTTSSADPLAAEATEPTSDTEAPTGEVVISSDDTTGQDESGAESDDESIDKARNCQVSCSLVGSQCSLSTIGGQGSTSFLGGCDKCYRRAKENAASKASLESCVVDTCVNLGCD